MFGRFSAPGRRPNSQAGRLRYTQRRIVAEPDALQAAVDALKRLQAETAVLKMLKLEKLKAKMESAIVDRGTHSVPARSGCALLLRKILLTRSQLARIKGEL